MNYLDSDIEAVSYVLELELQVESLKSQNAKMQSLLINKDIKIGNINAEKKKCEALRNEALKKNEELLNTSVSKKLFNENISKLTQILKDQRKVSENEEQRKVFEDFILILNKLNVND